MECEFARIVKLRTVHSVYELYWKFAFTLRSGMLFGLVHGKKTLFPSARLQYECCNAIKLSSKSVVFDTFVVATILRLHFNWKILEKLYFTAWVLNIIMLYSVS